MKRRAFLRRMAVAAMACAFLDVRPLLASHESEPGDDWAELQNYADRCAAEGRPFVLRGGDYTLSRTVVVWDGAGGVIEGVNFRPTMTDDTPFLHIVSDRGAMAVRSWDRRIGLAL